MSQPTLFLTVGLAATRKTTAARRIEIEQDALRLTKDEWVKALYGHENPPSAQAVIEGRLIQIGLRAYFHLTPAEQRSRLAQREAEAAHTTWRMSGEELAGWAARIDIPTPEEAPRRCRAARRCPGIAAAPGAAPAVNGVLPRRRGGHVSRGRHR